MPRESHRYFMKELGGTQAQTIVYTRFVSFIQSIRKHPKFPVQFILNLTKDNILSVTGKNNRKILTETGHDDIFKVKVREMKKNYNFCAIDEENKWKVEVIKELTDVKQGSVCIEYEDGGNFLSRADSDPYINKVKKGFDS